MFYIYCEDSHVFFLRHWWSYIPPLCCFMLIILLLNFHAAFLHKFLFSQNQRYVEAGTSVLGPVISILQPLELVRNWEDLTPQFYAMFWSLTMTDLMVPTASYEKQVTQFKQQLIAIEENHELVRKLIPLVSPALCIPDKCY